MSIVLVFLRLNSILRLFYLQPFTFIGSGQFWIMMYGTYAKYFKELQPQIGHFLTLVNPEPEKWQFSQDADTDVFLRFVIGPKLRTKVCLHNDIPVIQTPIIQIDERVREISLHPRQPVRYTGCAIFS